MTLLAFGSTNFFNRNAIVFMILYIVVKFFVNIIKFVAMALVIIKLNVCCTMAIDTPSHAQVGKLFNLIHFLNFTMTGLTLNPANFYVLGMIEISQVRQVMNLYPFNWLTRLVVGFAGRIPAGILI